MEFLGELSLVHLAESDLVSFRFAALVCLLLCFVLSFFHWVKQSKKCASISDVMEKQKTFCFLMFLMDYLKQ